MQKFQLVQFEYEVKFYGICGRLKTAVGGNMMNALQSLVYSENTDELKIRLNMSLQIMIMMQFN